MTDINHVVVIGRITRDVSEQDFAYLPNGMARLNTSIAVNRSRKMQDGNYQDEASFFDITLWSKTAENLKPYIVKGQQIAIDGHLRQDRWEKDGQKYSRVSIVVESAQLIGGNRQNTNNTQQNYQPQQQYNAQPQQQYNANPYQQPQQYQQNGGYNPQQQAYNNYGFPEDIPF